MDRLTEEQLTKVRKCFGTFSAHFVIFIVSSELTRIVTEKFGKTSCGAVLSDLSIQNVENSGLISVDLSRSRPSCFVL